MGNADRKSDFGVIDFNGDGADGEAVGGGEVAAIGVGKRRNGSGGGVGGDGRRIRSREEEVKLAGAEEVGGVSCVPRR